jgi:general secretion pathway protein D
VAGRLFGSQKDDNQSSEILLSITPRIVRSIQRPDLLDAEFESGTESNIGAQTLRLATVAPNAIDGRAESVSSKLAPTAAPKSAPAGAMARGAIDEPRLEPVRAPSVAASVGSLNITWQTPAQVRVGEQFSAMVRINSALALRGLPVLLGFDPQVLQVVNVEEGGFFKQANGQTNFSHRVDPAQGKVFATLVRQARNPQDSGVNGMGELVRVNFKAIKAGGTTRLQLLSAAAEPPPPSPLNFPIEQVIRVVP